MKFELDTEAKTIVILDSIPVEQVMELITKLGLKDYSIISKCTIEWLPLNPCYPKYNPPVYIPPYNLPPITCNS